MKKSTIKTIRFALNMLRDMNYSISFRTQSGVRFEQAKLDIEKDNDAILDFESFVSENGFNEV